jgi:hypothetical protein
MYIRSVVVVLSYPAMLSRLIDVLLLYYYYYYYCCYYYWLLQPLVVVPFF